MGSVCRGALLTIDVAAMPEHKKLVIFNLVDDTVAPLPDAIEALLAC